MTMPSFKQVESNYSKKEPCKPGCSWIIKFCHCFDFGYYRCGIIFSIWTQNEFTHCMDEEKNLWSEQLLILFKKELISFCFFFQEEIASFLGVEKLVNLYPVKTFSLVLTLETVFFVELKFCAQIKEEEYKCDSNIGVVKQGYENIFF